MKKVTLFLLVLMLAVSFWGCSDNSATDPTSDLSAEKAAVLDALNEEVDYFPNEMRDSDEYLDPIAEGLSLDNPIIADDLQPIRFGRQVLEHTTSRSVEFPTDTTAVVTITQAVNGTLHILSVNEEDSTIAHFEKPFADDFLRYVHLEKRQWIPNRPPHWRMVGMTGTLVQSPETSVAIQSITVGHNDGTVQSFTDPLEVIDRDNIISVAPGEWVTLTITTAAADDEAFLHFQPRERARIHFEANGDNTYTLSWRAPLRVGIHHATFDVLSHDTLFDSEAPYEDMGWGFSYAVVRP